MRGSRVVARVVSVMVSLCVVCACCVSLLLLLAPPLPSYHPFHPNHAHLPSAYLPHPTTSSSLSRWSPSYLLSTLLVPTSYIEGWYLKLHTADGRHYALIYFYFVSATASNSVSGLMLLDAQREDSHLYAFPLAAFASSPLPTAAATLRHLTAHSQDSEASPSHPSPFHHFTLHIDEGSGSNSRSANNSLSPSHITVHLPPTSSSSSSSSSASPAPSVSLSAALRPSAASVSAAATLRRSSGWLRPSFFSPASHTVGLFAFLPLACYQQIIEMDLHVEGHFTLEGEEVDLRGAKAYLEKTRGFSFPDHYVWMHADAFHADAGGDEPSLLSSLFFSVASVPILPTSLHLPGFVCAFLYNSTLLTLSTQEGAVLTHLAVTDEHFTAVAWERGWKRRLTIDVQRTQGRRRRGSGSGGSTLSGRTAAQGTETPVGKPDSGKQEEEEEEELEGEGWLWAARGGALKRVIHQQLGLDRVTVTWAEAVQGEEAEGRGTGGGTEGLEGGVVGVESEASEWRSRGWSFRPLLADSSRSMGLEVFTRNAAAFERQVRDMYAQVRPWTRTQWWDVHTPIVSFPLSHHLFLTCLPAPLASALRRHAWILRHTRTIVTAALACIALPLLLRRIRRGLDTAHSTRG